MIRIVAILLFCIVQTQSLSLQKRAVFDIIPKLEKYNSLVDEDMFDVKQDDLSPGAKCKCQNGSEVCVLDSRFRCRPLFSILGGKGVEEVEEMQSRRIVKKRLSNMVMKWIRMKNAEERVLELEEMTL